MLVRRTAEDVAFMQRCEAQPGWRDGAFKVRINAAAECRARGDFHGADRHTRIANEILAGGDA